MKLCLQDIVANVNALSMITVREQAFEIEYYLGGDWKFLAMMTGIDSASSTYACIWCKCPALNRYDTTQKWSIDDIVLVHVQSRKTRESPSPDPSVLM